MSDHLHEKNSVTDIEKYSVSRADSTDHHVIPGDKHGWLSHPLAKSLLSWGVEERGAFPLSLMYSSNIFAQAPFQFLNWSGQTLNSIRFSSFGSP
jgi:hypothetical protein